MGGGRLFNIREYSPSNSMQETSEAKQTSVNGFPCQNKQFHKLYLPRTIQGFLNFLAICEGGFLQYKQFLIKKFVS